MKESLNDIIARLDGENKSIKRDLGLIKSANIKSQELLYNKINALNDDINVIKRDSDKKTHDLLLTINELKKEFNKEKDSNSNNISELKNEIKGLVSMIKAIKPNPIKAFTDKDIKLSIGSVVTQDYITNLYRNK